MSTTFRGNYVSTANGNYNQTRPEVSRALNAADAINKAMRRRRMGGETERQWMLLRNELNALALVYQLRQLR